MRLIEHFRELWRYRTLIGSLVRRDVAMRYRGSVLGYLWTMLNPLMLLAVYNLVFSQIMRAVSLPHYALFLFVGLLPWLWLSGSLNNGALSIANGGSLITRVYIPPQVLPAVVVLSNFAHFLFALPVAVGGAALVGLTPAAAILALPLAMPAALLFLYGLSLLAATLAVPWRDVQFLVGNLVMIWFFLTPIVYPLDSIPAVWRPLVAANPATVLIHPFQRMLYERHFPQPAELAVGAAWAVAAMVLGVLVFERLRGRLAEEI
jgi:ABC-type polysaccharide/polyol phosphate export permease